MRHLLKLLFFTVFTCCAVSFFMACDEASESSVGRLSPLFNFVTKSTLKEKSFDSLTVVALNTVRGDSIIIDNEKNVTSATLPLSYVKNKTALVFKYSKDTIDTVWVTHTNTEHFISMDRGVAMFYHIDKVEHTKHLIDSIAIVNSEVNINEKENIRIYY